ncbi:response regulator transcription factor [Paenibacillus crassostreae]|uniref:Two-component system response regulator n=1 Tax=Paenibacillus crassostreae TaxID=1763538 RepID=A0A167DSX5_9BACL|nr:response regulator transcription factor [Paenibacillus crassostreae]AOZ91099.1 hypothetical protein LPB68_02015 [Paenibacillus crassostreae]OAB74741.1 hypothetical protein PNBC_11940 [Paenibacillus crassostreae]
MANIILYVNYESETALTTIEALRIEQYEVVEVEHDQEALSFIENNETINMVILDYGKSRDEYSVIRPMRARIKFFPIMVLSHMELDENVVNAFRLGANEYINKPVVNDILLLRILNIFNLLSIKQLENYLPIQIGELHIDLRSRQVMRNLQAVVLTPKEYDLMLYLARHVNQVCSRDQILKEVWKYEYAMGTNVVDVYIRYLRLKIDKGHRDKMIHTLRGVGYILRVN